MSSSVLGPLIVIPAHNEAASIGQVVRALQACGFDLVVIDDASSDATGAIARSAGADVIQLGVNLGVGGALRCAFRYAVARGYCSVVQCDGDDQHPPESIQSLLDASRLTGAHMVIGSRFVGLGNTMSVSWLRRVAMHVLSAMASDAAGKSLTDVTSGFRHISEPLLSEFAASFPTHYLGDTAEAVVVAAKAGYHIEEVSAPIRPRVHGQSTASRTFASLMVARSVLVIVLRLHFQINRHVKSA